MAVAAAVPPLAVAVAVVVAVVSYTHRQNATKKMLSKTSAMLLFVDMELLRLLKVLFHWNDCLLKPPAHRFVRTSNHNGSW